MAKISELSDGGSLQSTDFLIAVRSGGNVKVQADGNLSLGTVTADGLTVDGDAEVSSTSPTLYLMESDTTDTNWRARVVAGDLYLGRVDDAKANTGYSALFDANGDISFYEDTGTTAKFFWDASAESLGIGTSSPASPLHVSATNDIARFQGSDAQIIIGNSSAGVIDITSAGTGDDLAFGTNSTERMRLDSSGQVGIGTSSPTHNLHIEDSATTQIKIKNTTNNAEVRIGSSSTGGDGFVGTASNDDLSIITNNSTRVTVDTSGHLLVGLTTGADALIHAQAPKATYTDYGTVFAGGTDSNDAQHGISLMTAGNSLAGIIGSNLAIDGTTYSQPVAARSSGYISFENSTTAGKTSIIKFGGFTPGTTTALPKMTLDGDGNFLVGTTATPTSSVGNIVLANGTAPTASATDGVILYAEDVSSSSELKVRDEAGNITTLSPHNFDLIPQGPSEDMAWSYYSERDGKSINVDMLKAIRVLEKLSGEQLVFEN